MRCVVIHGSPRRGNTWTVLNLVKEEMKKQGDFEFVDIELRKENIPNCNGCFLCFFKGEERCPHKEKMENIVLEIESSDMLIMTSPVYSLQVSGLLKTFIDHMSYNFHRPKFFEKKGLVITTTAGAGHNNSAKYVRDVLYYWGFNYVEVLPIAYRSSNLNDKNIEKIKNISKKFTRDVLSNQLHKPKLKSVFMYNSWRAMAKEPYEEGDADYKYWKSTGLSNYVYYPEIKITPFSRYIGKIAYNIMRSMGKK